MRPGWLVVVACVAACVAVDDVNILRCCPPGETLRSDADADASCRPAPSDARWPPYIYSPRDKAFRDLPPEWRVSVGRPRCADPVAVVSAPSAAPAFLMFDNGSLWVQDAHQLQRPDAYCVEQFVALVCLDADDRDAVETDARRRQRRVRVRKCCGVGGAYSESRRACVHVGAEGDALPDLGSNLTHGATLFTTGFPACPTAETHVSFVIAGVWSERDARIDADGVLHMRGVATPADAFCLERVTEQPTQRASIFTCPASRNASGASGASGASDLRFALYPVGLVLSVFFLAATLAVGCVLPSAHQHMLHWRCQTGHVACLLVGDLLLAATQFAGDRLGSPFCEAFAVAMHFFFLAAFFWLNTMCFNIWWTFRDLRPASLDKAQEAFRLRLYQLYAWGGSLLIAGIAAVVDNLPEDTALSLLRPRFGHQRCWFYGDVEIFTYFYGPVGFLLAVNMALFAMTARELTCGLWKRDVAKTSVERTALGRVCLKLVVVMGLTWLADVLSWAVGGPRALWYLTDLVNALQGVFIFAVVGCQPQVWAAVNRLWCFKGNQRTDGHVGANVSSCSQGLPSMGDSVTASSPQTKPTPIETSC